MTFVAKIAHLRLPHFVLIATSDRSTATPTTVGRLVVTQHKEVRLEEENLKEDSLEPTSPRVPTPPKSQQRPHFVLIAPSDRSTADPTTAERLVATQQKEVRLEEDNLEEDRMDPGSPWLPTKSKP